MPIQLDKEVVVQEEESDIFIDSRSSDEVSEVSEDELIRMVKVGKPYCGHFKFRFIYNIFSVQSKDFRQIYRSVITNKYVELY